ncbi:MAG TPA: hypothetical protein VGB00_07965 [Pyrinomonadaceae bacterium]|jgi:hypothetical protein
MKKFTISLTLLFLAFSAQIGFGQNTPSNKETIIKAARFLEENPFDKDAKKIRIEAIKSIRQPGIGRFIACSIDFKSIIPPSYKFRNNLLAVYFIGRAAFVLENPEKSGDPDVSMVGGMESMVKSYEQMVKMNSKAKLAKLDDLTTARKNNSLASLFTCLDF